MAQVGFFKGQLVLLNEEQFTDQSIHEQQEAVHIIRGGFRGKLGPLGQQFLTTHGVKDQEALILVVDNHPTSVAAILGAMQMHCVCVLLSMSRLELLQHVVHQTGLTTIVDATGLDDRNQVLNKVIQQALQSFEKSQEPSVSGEGNSQHQLQWIKQLQALTSASCGGGGGGSSGGGVCLLTSGSVGVAKLVACSWASMLCQGRVTCEQMFANQPARLLCMSSISHAYAINAIFALFESPFGDQSELHFAKTIKGFMPLLAAQPLSSTPVCRTLMYGTPSTYLSLLKLPSCRLHVDVAYSAGSPLSKQVYCAVQEKFNVTVMQNYGSTETGNIAAWGLNQQAIESEQVVFEGNRWLYAGTLWPGVRMLQDPTTLELMVRSPWQSTGYIADQTLVLHAGEFHHMADRGCFNQLNAQAVQVFLQERIRECIQNESGVRFAPQQLELVFLSHDQVSDAVVFQRIRDADKLEVQVRLVVQPTSTSVCESLTSSPTASDLLQWYEQKRIEQHESADAKWLPHPSHLRIQLVPFLECSPAGKLMLN